MSDVEALARRFLLPLHFEVQFIMQHPLDMIPYFQYSCFCSAKENDAWNTGLGDSQILIVNIRMSR
jgi:hypothetical protein